MLKIKLIVVATLLHIFTQNTQVAYIQFYLLYDNLFIIIYI